MAFSRIFALLVLFAYAFPEHEARAQVAMERLENVRLTNELFLHGANKTGRHVGIATGDPSIVIPEDAKKAGVMIAGATGDFTVLSYSGTANSLTYYDGLGVRQWTRPVRSDQSWFGGQDIRLSHEMSEDGERIVVYGSHDEDSFIVGVYNRNGEVVATDAPFRHMASSGRYFYGSDPFYSDTSLRMFDADLTPVEQDIEALLSVDRTKFDYRFKYRVLTDDLMVATVLEFEKDQQRDPRLQPYQPRRRPTFPEPSRYELVAVDIHHERVLATVHLTKHQTITTNARSISVSLTENNIDLRGNTMVAIAVHFGDGARIIKADLVTGRISEQPVARITGVNLSVDGKQYLVTRNLGTTGQIEIREVATDKLLHRSESLQFSSIASFRAVKDDFLLLRSDHPSLQRLLVASSPQSSGLVGWFDTNITQGLAPLQSNEQLGRLALLRITTADK